MIEIPSFDGSELEPRNPETLAERARVESYIAELPVEQLAPDGWEDDGWVVTPESRWKSLPDLWGSGELVDVAVLVDEDPDYNTRTLSVVHRCEDGRGKVAATFRPDVQKMLLVMLDYATTLRFNRVSWESDTAAAFLGMIELYRAIESAE